MRDMQSGGSSGAALPGLLNNRRLFATLCTCSVALSALCLPAAANAQDAAAKDDAVAPSGLQEIVVTAQKREQRLQDVPVAVTALGRDALEANKIDTIRDLSAFVPNLTVKTQVGGTNLPVFSMRGLAVQGSAAGSDRGIAIYYDGVYMGGANGTILEVADIERIEVLRGPQGTLFGRNSTGGAIQFVTPEPSGELGVTQKLTLGTFSQFRSSTTINTPQFGAFSARFTYTHSQVDGDMDNLGAGTRYNFGPAIGKPTKFFTSPSKLGGQNVDAFMAAVKFEPSDDLKMIARFDWSENVFSQRPLGVTYIAPLVQGLGFGQADLTQVSLKRPNAVNNWGTVPGVSKGWGTSLNLDYRISDAVSLRNIFGYRKVHTIVPVADISGYGGIYNNGNPLFGLLLGGPLAASTVGAPFWILESSNDDNVRQWSEELQLNVNTRIVTVTTGLMYYDQFEAAGGYGSPQFEQSTIGGLPNGLPFLILPNFVVPNAGQPFGTRGRSTRIKTRSYAGYLHGEFHVTDQIDVLAGIRYTNDRKRGPDFFSYNGAVPLELFQKYDGHKVTYNIGVNYKPNSDILLYAKYATGFISGGSLAGFPYRPEVAKSWEAGVKADLFDRHVRANVALFRVKYSDLQFSSGGQALNPPRPEIGQLLLNAGDARAQGVELETTVIPVQGLTLTANVGYLDFKFLRLDPAILSAYSEAFAPFRPDWTLNVAAQYETPLDDDVTASFRLDANWSSKIISVQGVYVSIPADQRDAFVRTAVVPAHWIANARVSFRGMKLGRLNSEFALWARNLFNNRDPNYIISYPQLMNAAEYERPRWFGMDFRIEL